MGAVAAATGALIQQRQRHMAPAWGRAAACALTALACSAYESSMEALQQPTIRVVAVIAEGVPEADTKRLIAYARAHNKILLGPATVGGIQARSCLSTSCEQEHWQHAAAPSRPVDPAPHLLVRAHARVPPPWAASRCVACLALPPAPRPVRAGLAAAGWSTEQARGQVVRPETGTRPEQAATLASVRHAWPPVLNRVQPAHLRPAAGPSPHPDPCACRTCPVCRQASSGSIAVTPPCPVVRPACPCTAAGTSPHACPAQRRRAPSGRAVLMPCSPLVRPACACAAAAPRPERRAGVRPQDRQHCGNAKQGPPICYGLHA